MFEKPLGLRENPFLAGHHPKYLFPSREHQEALAHLRYGIQNREPFVLITGEVGTGKTTAVYDALAEWGSRAQVALITNSALTRGELLEEICLRFGVTVPSPLSKPLALVGLQKQLSAVRERGELAILLVDEAQNLDRELLEEIRLLSNLELGGEYLLQIFLVGQTELESKLAQKELRQLRQRIGIHYRILPLSGSETARYIHHRVAVAGGNAEELFPADTCLEIFRITNGIPREINIVAGQSLLNAFVDDSRSVSIEHVRGVEREIEFQSVLRHQAGKLTEPAAPAEGTREGGNPAGTPAPSATILPITSAHSTGAVEPSRRAPPPIDHVAHEVTAESEMDVEMTESAFGETLPDSDDSLVGEFPVGDEPHLADDDFEERTIPAAERGAPDLVLPSWIDEIVARRQTIEARAAASPPTSPWAPSAPPTGPAPNVVEPAPGFGHAAPPPPSGAMLAAPPPERIAPHPAEPIPLFDRPGDPRRLPPRLRGKLEEEEVGEDEEPEVRSRASMAWPIASLVIAAIAIAGLLVVRFGPWSLERRGVAPQGAQAPAGAPDTSLDQSGSFPPLAGLGESGVRTVTSTESVAGQPPSRSGPDPLAPNASAMGGTGASGPTGTHSGSPPPAGMTGGGAGSDAPSVSNGSFGIAVGTYLNEGRADAERTRLGGATKYTARVVAVAEDTVTMYRVVVGSFGDRTSAERAASELVQGGVVTEARVVTVPRPVSTRP
ncbi:MAG: AAA family ATPase [Candidatus Eiseniibacteriota bacterium]